MTTGGTESKFILGCLGTFLRNQITSKSPKFYKCINYTFLYLYNNFLGIGGLGRAGKVVEKLYSFYLQ